MSKQQMRLRFIEGGEGGGTPAPTPPATPAPGEPADEPLGEPGKKALEAERQTVKDLRAELKALKDAAEAAKSPAPKPAPKPSDDGDVASALEELRQQLADEKSAREAAEVTALRVKLGASLPPEFVELLTGTTEEEIKAQVDKLAPHLKSSPGMVPNPQQGTPPGKSGGSVSAGRDRYRAAHPNS